MSDFVTFSNRQIALHNNVQMLKGVADLLPASTQRDDIENLRSALRRLPKRVVVLLDALDRMEADELQHY
jgi:hypothetical protein